MKSLVRLLRILLVLVALLAAVFWFAARRGDRGYFETQVQIDRPAPAVYRWLVQEDLMKRWITDLVALEKVPGGTGAYRIDETVGTQRVSLNVQVLRSTPNQEVVLAVTPAAATGTFSSQAQFKLLPNGDFTQLEFSSHTDYYDTKDQILEPIFTYLMQKKMREDMERLKVAVEAEAVSPSSPRR